MASSQVCPPKGGRYVIPSPRHQPSGSCLVDIEMELECGPSTHIHVCKASQVWERKEGLEESLHLSPTNIRDRPGGNLQVISVLKSSLF